ncbi:MAG: hypothetical protein A2W75_02715 [Nitrospinae bacterium RIFCSPLOWO2_12_39_15]|nr:MAG: hypothetical protein A2W75_02715 [Nitrospinae bacterium RIFCSPLOWO2_12_39_15]
MNELLAHLAGDYILQNDWMALGKYRSKGIALLHGIGYTIPFLFLTNDIFSLFIIGFTHSIIDHWKMANWIGQIRNWNFKTQDGFSAERPIWLTVWIGIITDNTMHLFINHIVLMKN